MNFNRGGHEPFMFLLSLISPLFKIILLKDFFLYDEIMIDHFRLLTFLI